MDSFRKYLHILYYIPWNIQMAVGIFSTSLRVEGVSGTMTIGSYILAVLHFQPPGNSPEWSRSWGGRQAGLGRHWFCERSNWEACEGLCYPLGHRTEWGKWRALERTDTQKFLERPCAVEIRGPQQGDSTGQISISYPRDWDRGDRGNLFRPPKRLSDWYVRYITYLWGTDCSAYHRWQGCHHLHYLRVSRVIGRQKKYNTAKGIQYPDTDRINKTLRIAAFGEIKLRKKTEYFDSINTAAT